MRSWNTTIGEVMVVTFIGHSRIYEYDKLKLQVSAILTRLANASGGELLCYCGGYGQFDDLCLSACEKLKETFPKMKTIFVTPYITEYYQKRMKLFLEYNMYDEFLYPPLEDVPLRFAITKRNEWMISRADTIIAFVNHTYGGAYKSLLYARRKNKILSA